MKYALTIGVGFLAGFAFFFVTQNPKQAAKQARAAADMIETTADSAIRDRCIKEFYAETSCLQKLPQKECDAQIAQRCGLPR